MRNQYEGEAGRSSAIGAKEVKATSGLTLSPLFNLPNLLRESYTRTPENYRETMIRPRVELAESQYEQLNELREKTDKLVSEMIREAISRFVRRNDYSISISASHLPRTLRENYRRATSYVPR